MVDRADAILTQAADLSVLSEASAVAVISLFVDDPALVENWHYGDEFRALVKAARDFIASMSGFWYGVRLWLAHVLLDLAAHLTN